MCVYMYMYMPYNVQMNSTYTCACEHEEGKLVLARKECSLTHTRTCDRHERNVGVLRCIAQEATPQQRTHVIAHT